MKPVTLSIMNDTGNIKSVMFDIDDDENIKDKLNEYYYSQELADDFINTKRFKRYFDNIENFKQDHWTYWYATTNYIFMNNSWYEIIANNYDDVQFINITQI
jgi:hypothetical protein